ncbi:hypothetical protein VKT23_004736 [Stygiomarasmius scandens]|uniref:Uncharacterized protein n=1 Tax=Marasmiellus scandens TaxID=2682957 RepID=A0ABR1JUW6_9AGAR
MNYLPTDGVFVVLTLDLVSTVAHFENEELTAACGRLEVGQKQFVAFVESDSLNPPMPWKDYNSFHFWILWQGFDQLPSPMKCRGVQPHMLLPVLPNTFHPTSSPDHLPVDPGQPLPWKDCYISGFVRLQGRCRTEWSDTEITAPYQTTLRNACRVGGQGEQDRTDVYSPLFTQKMLMRSRKGSFASEIPPEDRVECGGIEEKDPDVLSEKTIIAISGHREFQDKVVVQFSTDLSSVDTVNHPDELYKVLARFERLKTELETNRKRRQIEEARQIDEEHFARYPAPSPLLASKSVSDKCGSSPGFLKCFSPNSEFFI